MGTPRLPHSKTALANFILIKAQVWIKQLQWKDNNRGTCFAFSVRALHGISNVIQTLSPLAFHLFIYSLGQQWSKILLRSDSCLVVCAVLSAGPAACHAPAPPSLLKSRHKATPHCYTHGDLSWPHACGGRAGPALMRFHQGCGSKSETQWQSHHRGLGVCTGHLQALGGRLKAALQQYKCSLS